MANPALFRWQAVDSQGELQSGQLLAIGSENLLLMLAQRDLLPVSWKCEKAWRQADWTWQHKTDLIRQLATLLKACLPLAEGHPHPGWQALMMALHHRVLSGQPCSQALREWPQIFPALYPALMEVGELTGQLDVCCSDLAQQQTLPAAVMAAGREGATLSPFYFAGGNGRYLRHAAVRSAGVRDGICLV